MASRGGLSALALSEIAAGVILAWSGIQNATLQATLSSLIRGRRPAPDTGAGQISGTSGVPPGALTAPVGTGPGGPGTGGAPPRDLTGTEHANRALGRVLAAPYGWAAGQDWQALDHGWGSLESGWNNQVYNGGTVGGPYQPDKAYGIPQALGHGPGGAPFPAGNAGNPPGAGGDSSPAAQITWGLEYIRGRYGHPAAVPGWLGGPYQGY